MPNTTLTQAIKEAYAAAPTDTVILHTLELRHVALTVPIRVVLDNQDWVLTLEAGAPVNPGQAVTFIKFRFDFRIPDITDGSSPEMEVSMDNVDRSIVDGLEAANASPSKLELTYRQYTNLITSAPQNNPPLHLIVNHCEVNLFRATLRAGFGDTVNKSFPGETYDVGRFPGLVV